VAFQSDTVATRLLAGANANDVLVFGHDGCKRYNPTGNSWVSPSGFAARTSILQAWAQTSDGAVYLFGGSADGGTTPNTAIQKYDPATDSWSTVATFATARQNVGAALLSSGKILVCGGSLAGGTKTAQAFLFDPADNSLTSTGALATARASHCLVALSDGTVAAIGGSGASGSLASVELFSGSSWSTKPSMNRARSGHACVALGTCTILAVAGDSVGGTTAEVSA
jgi:hypothetical protein